ncbi:mandelate racemase/muconate lactonizing enzyme family protein [Pollutimonas bauzanensis]|uniref:L-alanine-DL-glutamate epimerase n=1 Tax=Pollutimonas bauzanensis TaxID=658167 RepID=A0A1M5X7G7_9BURK|nr:mandelate racemase/muconate lactonizing enzyme family protein [Pollutimonas bauzanensis]SHH95731.1 L-alanine-DL-glutamate epimerase [Pollutimonas bauzanensis]
MNPHAIAEITAFPVSYPLPPGAQPGMGTGRIVRRDAIVVKVVTVGGTVGWGECFHARSHMAIATLINAYLAPLVEGMDATAVVDVWSKVYNYHLAGYGAGAACYIALSGIDIALWDIRGKVANMPLYRLLGGSPRRVRAYAGGLSLGFEAPDRLIERIQALAGAGYGAIKLRVGDTLENDIERLRRIREKFPALDIMTDANTAYTLADATKVLPVMDELRIGWLEEPFSMDDRDAYRLASQAGSTPLAAGENLYSKFEFVRAIEDGSIRILQPDLSKAGGITEGCRIAALAAAYKLPVHVHSSMTGINQAASIHFLASIENAGLFEADVSEGNKFRDELVTTPYAVDRDGCVAPNEGAGLGIEIDETFFARYPAAHGLTNKV